MKIICCNCKKEYDFADNIFKYNKANRPILICPHCGFKHIIDFMPFEKNIKVERIKKLNLGGYYPANIGASRYANATRVDQSLVDDRNIESGVVSSATYDSKFFLTTGQLSTPYGMFFNPDGNKMYVIGITSETVFQYTLSTPWDVSTASYANKSKDISTEEDTPYSVFFNPDGNKMYIVGDTQGTVFQYTLSTPWDVSTASYASKSKDVSGIDNISHGLFFNPDGDKMYISGSQYDAVYQWTLSTPWDVSTASYASKSCDLTGETISPHGLFINYNGTKLYVMGYYEFLAFQYTLSTPWDLSTASYANKSFDFSSEDNQATGIFLKPDGTKMYLLGHQNDKVHQYSLPAAWDKANDFILAIRIWGSKGPHVQAFKLRWRVAGGTWANVEATGAINHSAVTDLVDENALLTGEKICSVQDGYAWQNGLENEGDNILPNTGTYSLADENYTELQWALRCIDAEDEAEYEFELWDVTENTSLGTCLATITMEVATGAGVKDATGKASINSSVISILSRGKIEGATAKANINSSMIATLLKGLIKNATGKASIITLLSAILARGKIEDATAKANIATNIVSILSRGKIEDRTAKADITTLIQVILSNFIDATGKASIDTNIDIVLSRGKIENATGKADIESSIISILSRGQIETATGKSSVTSNFESILSRGKIENTSGKAEITSLLTAIVKGIYRGRGEASITSIITSILSRGKIEDTTGKSSVGTSIIALLSRGKIEGVTGKSEISTSVIAILTRGKIETATSKASISSNIDVALSRGKIENATGEADIVSNFIAVLQKEAGINASGKASVSSTINIILLRGKIENTGGKASITSNIDVTLSRGAIEDTSGKANINTLVVTILSRGKIENTTGKADITSNINILLSRGIIQDALGTASIITEIGSILSRGKIENVTGKSQVKTNIETSVKRVIARAGKASLETSYDAIISKGKIENVNGKAFIYTSINTRLLSSKRATGKASINSFINISLKKFLNASGKSIFDTLIEIEITKEYTFSQATLGIIRNQTELLIKETDTEIGIKGTETKLRIER